MLIGQVSWALAVLGACVSLGSSDYALGRITYDGTGSLLSAANWTKAPSPVFAKTSEIVGVGHAPFVASPDGTQDWIVYHSHPSPGGDADARVVHIQPFTWFADNTPNFGPPISNNVKQEVPSGLAAANRTLLSGDYDASGAVNALDLQVFKGQFGQTLTPGISADGAADGFIDGADFLQWQRQLGATPATAAASAAATAERSAIPASSAALSAASLDAIYAAGDFTVLFNPPRDFRPERRSRF